MAAFFSSLNRTLIAGLVIVLVMIGIAGTYNSFGERGYWTFFMRWIHIASGVMWIGILYYFNFVQTPSMPKIPDEQKPAVSKVIAPAALFWFRWGAMSTIVTGLLLAMMSGYLVQAISLQKPFTAIGVGMWLGTIMWFNVWFIIWPNQKKALGIVTVTPEEKAAAAKLAGMTSRINVMLSLPMLYCMVAQQHGGF
jgi:uncharacterized membrane protein